MRLSTEMKEYFTTYCLWKLLGRNASSEYGIEITQEAFPTTKQLFVG